MVEFSKSKHTTHEIGCVRQNPVSSDDICFMRKDQKLIYWMSIFMGVFLPLAETVRRFRQLADLSHIMYWFDDYILGGILLISAWLLKSKKSNAISYMIAAWGIGTGALFLSFLGQIDHIQSNSEDPGGIFSAWFVLIVKGLILVFMIFGMIKSINAADLQKNGINSN